MAKTTGPLLSIEAHGSLSKILTYSRRRSGSQARKYNKPTVPATAKQRGQRRLTEFLVAQWQNMSAADKATWAANARPTGLNLSGYHYFLRTAQKDLYTHHGLLGYWHCNEIIGGQILDLSGRGNHGTLEPSYPSDVPILVNSYNTRLNKALLYDGVNEYVNIPSKVSVFRYPNWTIEMFFKSEESRSVYADIYLEMDANSSYAHIGFYKWLVGQWSFRLYDGDSYIVTSTKLVNDGKWHCGTVSNLNGTVSLYIDRVYQAAIGNVPTLVPPLITQKIGQSQADPVFFNGIIDEICLYNRALSAAEIATRYKFAIRDI